MNTYETMVLLDNREVKKGWDELKGTVSGYFTKHNAEVISARRWDERRLAYEIKRQQRGTYLLLYYRAPGSDLPGIRRELDYSEIVLRHLTQVCEEIPEEAHEPEAEFDETEIRLGDEVDEPPKAEVKTDGKAAGDKAEAKADDKAGAKADAKAEAKADAKAEAKADAKAEAKADAKAEAKADDKADAKADDKAGAKAETDASPAADTPVDDAPAAAPAEETKK